MIFSFTSSILYSNWYVQRKPDCNSFFFVVLSGVACYTEKKIENMCFSLISIRLFWSASIRPYSKCLPNKIFLLFGHFNFRRKRKQTAATNNTNTRQSIAQINIYWDLKIKKKSTITGREEPARKLVNMTISPALCPAVTVTVVIDWKIRTALTTNQIAGFVTVPSWKKNKYVVLKIPNILKMGWRERHCIQATFLIGDGIKYSRKGSTIP